MLAYVVILLWASRFLRIFQGYDEVSWGIADKAMVDPGHARTEDIRVFDKGGQKHG